jgi:putative peptidoglycan lipid II flippase
VNEPAEESLDGSDESRPPRGTGAAAVLVGIGIFTSRLFGIARQVLMAKYLGAGVAADAFMASFKITNILQNLFGEGALSASFIPVYSKLLEHGDEKDAGKVAGAVAAILSLTVAVIVLVGVVATPLLIPLIATGFKGETRELTIHLTRILFPGAGVFVLSAWCLGILNSHRRFLLPYLAPVLWNVVMIGTLVWAGPKQQPRDLASTLAWASVIGATVQFLVQLPTALRLAKHLRFSLSRELPEVRVVTSNFGGAFMSRGVVQISSYIDNWLATFLPGGMVATFGYASAIVVLPVSLFGMAVSAAELPEMSRATGDERAIAAKLKDSLTRGLRKIAFFVVPSAAAFIGFGDVIARILLERGNFRPEFTRFAWGILAGAAVGLLASTFGRLYSSTFYALRDTRTPLRFAIARVVLSTAMGSIFALLVPRWLGIDPRWGAAGLSISSGIAGWVEFALLRSSLNARIGVTGVSAKLVLSLWFAAALGAVAGWEMRGLVSGRHNVLDGLLILGVYGVTYVLSTVALGVPEARDAIEKILKRFR